MQKLVLLNIHTNIKAKSELLLNNYQYHTPISELKYKENTHRGNACLILIFD